MNYISESPQNQLIREGDSCVIYISEQNKNILKILPDAQLTTKFGLIKAMDLLNHPYGVRYECKKGWILPLRLTPELWTELLPHRTQILYQADISLILLQLDIKPGSVVAESGTGSGSLSHAILRACLPNGFLHTFDINESRVQEARREFIEHGFGNNVRVTQRNICELGYEQELEGKVDACILDLPQTWLAIDKAYKILKPYGSRLCTFSPCIEQVQQNVAKMTELKLKDIVTMECLLRPFEVKTQKLRQWDDEVLDSLTIIDRLRYDDIKCNLSLAKRAKISDQHGLAEANNWPKPLKADSSSNGDHVEESLDLDKYSEKLQTFLKDPKAPFSPHMLPHKSHLHAKQMNETVGHSGYLTFASKRP